MVNGKIYRRVYRLIFAAAMTVFLIAGVTSVWNLAAIQQGYETAQDEYDRLRREFSPATPAPSLAAHIPETFSASAAEPVPEPDPARDLSSLNPDYIGWIRIEDTGIDYPVVQGQDNRKYLHTGFSGQENKSGAIFMDCQCAGGFDGLYIILFGHNMRDDSMFAGLNRYLEDGYLEEHPEINITTPEGELSAYKIISVKVTDKYDPAYALAGQDRQAADEYLTSLGVPEGTKVIVLSTCTDSNRKDERLLIFAAGI